MQTTDTSPAGPSLLRAFLGFVGSTVLTVTLMVALST